MLLAVFAAIAAIIATSGARPVDAAPADGVVTAADSSSSTDGSPPDQPTTPPVVTTGPATVTATATSTTTATTTTTATVTSVATPVVSAGTLQTLTTARITATVRATVTGTVTSTAGPVPASSTVIVFGGVDAQTAAPPAFDDATSAQSTPGTASPDSVAFRPAANSTSTARTAGAAVLLAIAILASVGFVKLRRRSH